MKNFKFALIPLFAGFVSLTQAAIPLKGAGATFPAPIYTKWISSFQKKDKSVEINYQSIGSGGGVANLISGTVDFGASDVPMKADEEARIPQKVMHIPTVLGAVVIAYNLKDVPELKLSPETLSKIFLGQITKWSDPLLKKENPTAKLPDQNIFVAYRSDGSGTTAVFTEYLGLVSPQWKSTVGSGKSVKFPSGAGGKGNEGVTNMVKDTPGAITYTELAYAVQNQLSMASLKNKDGVYVSLKKKDGSVDLSGITSAAKNVTMANFKDPIVNREGKNTYPISSLTFILVPLKKLEGDKKLKMKAFLNWALTDGQKEAAELHYAPLPSELAKDLQKGLEEI